MRCPYCLQQVTDQARFCENCGLPIGTAEKVCPTCQAKNNMSAKFCKGCGNPFVSIICKEGMSDSFFKRLDEIEAAMKPFKEQGEKLLQSGFAMEGEEMFRSGLRLLETHFHNESTASYHMSKANMQIGIAKVLTQRGNYADALRQLSEALRIIESFNDFPSRLQRADIYRLMGWNLIRTGEPGEAAMSYYKGLGALGDALENKQAAILFQGLGMLFRSLGMNEDAKSHLERSRQIRLKLRDQAGIAVTSINIGVLYTQMGDYRTAEGYFRGALEINQRLGVGEGVAICLADIGYVQYEVGDYDQAEQSLQSAIKTAEGHWPWIIRICYGYLARVAAARRQPETAREYTRKARDSMGSTLDPPNQAKLDELQALAESLEGRTEAALQFFGRAHSLREKLSEFDRGILLLNYAGCILSVARGRTDTAAARNDYRMAITQIGEALDDFRAIGNKKYIDICHDLLESLSKEDV